MSTLTRLRIPHYDKAVYEGRKVRRPHHQADGSEPSVGEHHADGTASFVHHDVWHADRRHGRRIDGLARDRRPVGVVDIAEVCESGRKAREQVARIRHAQRAHVADLPVFDAHGEVTVSGTHQPELRHTSDLSRLPHARHLGTFDARRNLRAQRLATARDWTGLALALALIAFMAVGF